jgi:hypothetical protein
MNPVMDGAGFRCGGRNFTVVVDDNEDGRSAWYECDSCGKAVGWGDDALSDHLCWFDDPAKLAAFALWMSDQDFDASEIVAAVEKPWHYNEEADEAGVR